MAQSNQVWTEKETQYLKDNYHKKTSAEIAKDLNMTLTRVRGRAYYLVAKKELAKKVKREARINGYKKKPNLKIPTPWDIEGNGCTIVHIAMCIKEDLNQTLEELAARVAESKECAYDEAYEVLHKLNGESKLHYYDKDKVPRLWRN